MGTEEGDIGRLDMPFVGIPSFLRSPVETDPSKIDADVAIMGAPFDEGSPFLPGSRFGPRSIREHSLRFVTGEDGYYDPQAGRHFLAEQMREHRFVDVGDADVLPTNPAGTFRNITDTVRAILGRGATPLILGGDHSITFPVVRAFEEPLHVVHFDAHLDYMPFVHGLEMTNAHAFRHIANMEHVESLSQVGIRSLRNTERMHRDSLADGNRVLTMADARAAGAGGVAGLVPDGAACYVSLDVDVLDLPLVPGCVSAEPNGMQYAELMDILSALAARTRIVGIDVVEVNPLLDVRTGITSYLAAHLAVEFLGRVCEGPHWIAARAGRDGR
jgi:agmatinase